MRCSTFSPLQLKSVASPTCESLCLVVLMTRQWQHRASSVPLHPPINAEHEAGQEACAVFQIFGMTRPGTRPATSLGHQEGGRVFREGPKFFELCPIFLNCANTFFQGGGRKIFKGGKIPPRLRACREPVFCGAYSTNEVIHPVIATRKIKMQHCFDSSHTFLYRIFAATSALTSTEAQVIGRTLTSNSCA